MLHSGMDFSAWQGVGLVLSTIAQHALSRWEAISPHIVYVSFHSTLSVISAYAPCDTQAEEKDTFYHTRTGSILAISIWPSVSRAHLRHWAFTVGFSKQRLLPIIGTAYCHLLKLLVWVW